MATKKKTTEAAKPEEKKVEAAASQEEKKETAPKRLSFKELEKLEASAEKLILKEDFEKVSELSNDPGLTLLGFRGVDGLLRLRIKYEVRGEILIDKLKTVHYL